MRSDVVRRGLPQAEADALIVLHDGGASRRAVGRHGGPTDKRAHAGADGVYVIHREIEVGVPMGPLDL